jgi:hypothetical protein
MIRQKIRRWWEKPFGSAIQKLFKMYLTWTKTDQSGRVDIYLRSGENYDGSLLSAWQCTEILKTV